MSQRLLFFTPKINEFDDDFSFCAMWVRAFEKEGFDVTVICLEKGEHALSMPVHSLGREKGWSRVRSTLYFLWLIFTLKYDRVFIHMNPRWLAVGSWYWVMRHMPVYLWYTHYSNTLSVKISSYVARRMFAATEQSLPQYAQNPRRVILSHGIDTDYWDVAPESESARAPKTELLAVHRISRSKRLDLVLKALKLLPREYTLTHYGRALDPRRDTAYEQEIRAIAADPILAGRVRFMGSLPMPELKKIYPHYRLSVNLVPGTIDKTVLEAMMCGAAPVITKEHANAIGYPFAPTDDSPEAVADFIQNYTLPSTEELKRVVREHHDLQKLVKKMSAYISYGK